MMNGELLAEIKTGCESSMRVIDHYLSWQAGSVYSSRSGNYFSFWVRDNVMASYCYEYTGRRDRSLKIFQNMWTALSAFRRAQLPANIPADYDWEGLLWPGRFARDFTPLFQEGGRLHLEYISLLLLRGAQLRLQGEAVWREKEDHELLQILVTYLEKNNWPEMEDYGLWEEGPALLSSSGGLIFQALTLLHKAIPTIRVQARMLSEGGQKVRGRLPAESEARKADMALLALIWPAGLLDGEQTVGVLQLVERELVKKKGVIRFVMDGYYNPRPDSPRGTEPRWPLGLYWLSLAYLTRIAQLRLGPAADGALPETLLGKAIYYWRSGQELKNHKGYIPELYSGGEANINTPFTWAESLSLAAGALIQHYMETVQPVAYVPPPHFHADAH